MKTTLITGVAGTTGSQILDYLAETEEVKSGRRNIVGIDNFFRGNIDNIKDHLSKPYFKFFEEDFRLLYQIPAYSQAYDYLHDLDEIYHMAAIVPTRYFYERPDLTYEINCQGTIDLFNWAIEFGVDRFIVGSSSEIYGHIESKDFPAKEDTMSHFDSEELSTRWSYAEGKLLTEHYLNHFKDKIKVCHLRFANTYGVRDLDDNHVLPYLVNRICRDEDAIINKYAEVYKRTFLNNKDSARACIEIMKNGKSGLAYNVGSSEEISILKLVNKIISIYEQKTGLKYTGKLIPEIERPGDPLRRVLSVERLYNDTGFIPKITLDEGINEMIDVVLTQVEFHKR